MLRRPRLSNLPLAAAWATAWIAGAVGPAQAAGPIAVHDTLATNLAPNMHLLLDVTANDGHSDGSAVLIQSVSTAGPAQVTVNPDSTLSFTLADPQGLTRVEFSYTLVDSRGRTASAEVCIGQCLQNVTVVCHGDAYTLETGEQATLAVLANDEGEDLEIVRVLPVEHQGNPVVAADGQSLIYTAAAVPGSDDFLYEVRQVGGTETATGAVHVDVVGGGGPGGGGTLIGEVGQATLAGRTAGNPNLPQFVPFTHTYERPVVIARPPTRNDAQEVVARITQVTPTGFWAYLSEPGSDATHVGDEQVTFIAVEAGRFRIPGSAAIVEAHRLETTAVVEHPEHYSDEVRFSEPFSGQPTSLHQVQSAVNISGGRPIWLDSRQAAVTPTGFLTALVRDPPNASTALGQEEVIGWIATHIGLGTWSQKDYAAGVANACPAGWLSCTVPYGRTFAAPPLFLGSLYTVMGGAGHLRRLSVGTASAVVAFEDNSVGGPPPSHPFGDWVGFLALEGAGDLYGEPLNRPPQAFSQTVTCTTGGSVSFAPSASDPDGDVLRIDAVEDAPTGLSHDGYVFTYAPSGGCAGAATFRHKVRDRAQDGFPSNWATVAIQYQNTTTVDARDDTYHERAELVTYEGQTLQIVDAVLFANDVPANGLFLMSAAPTAQTHGTLTVYNQNPGWSEVHYDPEPGYFGEATFTYTAIIPEGSPPYPQDTATVTVLVLRLNDPPVAVGDAVTIQRGVRVDVAVLANDSDPDGSSLRVVAVGAPGHGVAALNGDGTVRYTADPDYFGADSFTYTVTDDDPEDPKEATAPVQVTVTRDLRYDRFTNAPPSRDPGDPLPGLAVEEGAATWAGWQAQMGNGAATSNGDGTTAFAGVAVPDLPLSATGTYVVEALASLGAGNWAAVGFTSMAGQSFWSYGTLWASLHRAQQGGQVFLRGAGGATLASALVPQFESTGANLLKLEYDRPTQRAAVWVNGRRAISSFQLTGTPPKTGAAGFQLSYTAGTPANSMHIDDFSVRLQVGLSPLPTLISDGFGNLGFDRQNGQLLHRASTEQGGGRWWAANLRFGTVVAKVVPVPGQLNTSGYAVVPFVAENYVGSEGVPAVDVQARVRVGDGLGAWLGFGRALSAKSLAVAPELAAELLPDGRWKLFGPPTLGAGTFAEGTLAGFDPNAYLVIRVRFGPSGMSLWLGATQVVSDLVPFFPFYPQIRHAGFEVAISATASTAAVDNFAVWSEGAIP